MKLFLRGLCLVLAFALVLSFSACSQGPTWSARLGDDEMSVGTYILAVYTAYNELISGHIGDLNFTKQIYDQKIGELTTDQWMTAEAQNIIAQYYAVRQLAAEKDIELSEADLKAIAQNAEQQYVPREEDYDKMGVSLASLTKEYQDTELMSRVFLSIYGPDGEDPIPEDALRQEMNKQYSLIKFVAYPLFDDSGNMLTDAEQQALRTRAEKDVADFKSGKTFDEIYQEYQRSFLMIEEAQINSLSDAAYAILDSANSDGYPQEVADLAFELPVAGIQSVEAANHMFVILKYDIYDDYLYSSYVISNVMVSLKRGEFLDMLKEKAATINVEFNPAVISKYSAKNMKVGYVDSATASAAASASAASLAAAATAEATTAAAQ